MGSRVIMPEDVLETLMNDGTIDAIRLKIINQLKANEELKNNTISMVEQSKVLNTPGAEKQTKRVLFDALRQEIQAPVLEKASRAVWEIILDDNSLGKEIKENVENVYYRLSGHEPPPAPPLPPTSDSQNTEKELENKGKENREKVQEFEMSESSSRKRTFSEMNEEEGQQEVIFGGASDCLSVVSDDIS